MERLTERKWASTDNTQPTVVLELCAHCGASGEIVFEGKKVRVKCKKCGMTTPLFDLQTQAVGLWNKRVK